MGWREFLSPAKINLFLRILKRRADGFHELASLFQAVSLYDRLSMRLAARDRLTCNNPDLPTDSSNLILKALDLFRRKSGIAAYAEIDLEKRIPMEAGLGGGSSNAATALWGINQMTGSQVPAALLAEWGAEIGSDVPFFFSTGRAYCTGRGEQFQSLASPHAHAVCLVKPPFGLPTKQVYGALKVESLPHWDPEASLAQHLKGQFQCFNDLEVPAFHIRPALSHLKQQLQGCGFAHVLMSGSGSSFFCLGGPPEVTLPEMAIFSASFTSRSQEGWY